MTKKPLRKPRMFTMGHSDLSLEQFMTILEASSVRLVADVRANPASGRFPHFERNALAAELEKRGLVYRWFRELGGRRPPTPGEEEHTAFSEEGFRRYAAAMNTPRFTAAAADLMGVAASTVAVLLCAEKDYTMCHRRLLSDKLHVMGARVVHIVDLESAEEHVLHPDLRVDDGRLIYQKRQLELIT